MKKKPKSLGEIAYDNRPWQLFTGDDPAWNALSGPTKKEWGKTAKAVERAVVSKLKREGKIK